MDQLMQTMFLRLQQNIDEINDILGNPSDLQLKEFSIDGLNKDAALFYFHEMAQESTIEKSIVLPLLTIRHDDLVTNNESNHSKIQSIF